MATAGQSGGAQQLEVFEYPGSTEEPAWAGDAGWLAADAREPARQGAEMQNSAAAAKESALRSEFERRLAEEKARAFEAGRERGQKEGRQAEVEVRAAAKVAEDQQRARQAAKLIEGFGEQRDAYLREVEREVVELALAVAARILRREAQMDPLLLTGAVRVALGQLTGATEVRLKVPPTELELWTESIAAVPNLPVRPVVAAGEGMRLGECVIETELGSVDLGIRPQLSEIERGFFDRAGEQRPKALGMLEQGSVGSRGGQG
jgi:flagellar assembly protein FliH